MSDLPDKLSKLKVRVDENTCIGCGTCTVVAPQVFDFNEEGKATVKQDANLSDADSILNAAKSCPVSAIIVSDENGKKIYPVIK